MRQINGVMGQYMDENRNSFPHPEENGTHEAEHPTYKWVFHINQGYLGGEKDRLGKVWHCPGNKKKDAIAEGMTDTNGNALSYAMSWHSAWKKTDKLGFKYRPTRHIIIMGSRWSSLVEDPDFGDAFGGIVRRKPPNSTFLVGSLGPWHRGSGGEKGAAKQWFTNLAFGDGHVDAHRGSLREDLESGKITW